MDAAQTDSKGRSLLLQAVIGGDVAAVRAQLECGGSVADRDDDGWTALMHAAYRNNVAAASVLIDAGAQVEAEAHNGVTALMAAARAGAIECITALLDAGVDIARTSGNGSSALGYAAARGRMSAASALAAAGAAVDQRYHKQRTPLILAATHGHPNTVGRLIELGADVEAVEQSDYRPLHLAAYQGHVDVITRLIAAGADVAAAGDERWTPVMLAASNGHPKAIKALAAAGAPLDAVDDSGHTAVYLAAAAGYEFAVRELLTLGARTDPSAANETPMHGAAASGNLKVVALLLKAGVPTDDENEDGRTPLMIAKRANRWVADLIANGSAKEIDALARYVPDEALETWWPGALELNAGCVIRPGWLDITGPEDNIIVSHEDFLAGAENDYVRSIVGSEAFFTLLVAVQNSDANPRLHVERRMDQELARAWAAIPVDAELSRLAQHAEVHATRQYLNDPEGITRVDFPSGRSVRIETLAAFFPLPGGKELTVELDGYHTGALAFGEYTCMSAGEHILILNADGDETYSSHRHRDTYALGTRCCIREILRSGKRLLVEYDNYALMEPSRYTRVVGRRGFIELHPERGPIARYPVFT